MLQQVSLSEGERVRLRAGFDTDATTFDRTRPICPPEMFDDLVGLSHLGAGARVVEIGCGTGQATLPMARRGLWVTAIELGPDLAALARANLSDLDNVQVITTSFEEWEPDEPGFDAVVAFNSMHWIDPTVRYAKPFRLLRAGGVLVQASCRWAVQADAHPFWRDVQDDYRAVAAPGEPSPPPEAIEAEHLAPDARRYFEEIAARRYPFTVDYRPEDYLANLSTQTVVRQLGGDAGAIFLSRVEDRLWRLGWPTLTASFVGLLTIGRRTT